MRFLASDDCVVKSFLRLHVPTGHSARWIPLTSSSCCRFRWLITSSAPGQSPPLPPPGKIFKDPKRPALGSASWGSSGHTLPAQSHLCSNSSAGWPEPAQSQPRTLSLAQLGRNQELAPIGQSLIRFLAFLSPRSPWETCSLEEEQPRPRTGIWTCS